MLPFSAHGRYGDREMISYLLIYALADLHQIIRSGQELSSDHIAYFIYQILSGKSNTIPFDSVFLPGF